MSNITRELLLTTKTVRQWQDTFDQQVDAIIDTINKVDTIEEVARTTEVLDVYHHTSLHTSRSSQAPQPFGVWRPPLRIPDLLQLGLVRMICGFR
jgi:hypothetical protein